MTFEILSGILGGLALFLFGMELASGGLRRAAGPGLHAAIERLTRNRWTGLVAGILLSLGMQGSSAATVMLVGLVDTGILSLLRALPVDLGTAIGTTFTVQIIAFDVANGALVLLAVGLAVRWASAYDRHKRLGDVILGLGLIFYGMVVMKAGARPLAQQAWFRDLLVRFADSPLLGVVVSTALTAVIQSSAATIAMVMSFASSQVGPASAAEEAHLMLRLAVPLILGANVGTAATALLASAKASRAGKRLAVANLIFKTAAALVWLPVAGPFAEFVSRGTLLLARGDLSAAVARGIANAHTLYNVAAALLMLPLVARLERLTMWLLPDRKRASGARFLAPRLLDMPEVALHAIGAEVGRMAADVRAMYDLSRAALLEKDPVALDRLPHEEEKADAALAETTAFAVELSLRPLDERASRRRDALLFSLRAMENIADLLSRDLSHQAGKLVERGAEFSPDGRRELEAVFDEVGRSFDQTLGVLAQAGRPAADEVRRRDREMEARWCDLSARHFARLTQQVPETAGTDEIHMDVVTTLRQAHSLLAASVEALTDPRAGAPATSPAADKA